MKLDADNAAPRFLRDDLDVVLRDHVDRFGVAKTAEQLRVPRHAVVGSLARVRQRRGTLVILEMALERAVAEQQHVDEQVA